ncbi:MAG: dephospho-CoA kinase [Planctomycetota bacterium]
MYALVEYLQLESVKLIHPKLIKIGLAGGIGSGKSFVSSLFGSSGAYVSNADEISRMILNKPEVIEQLVEWWGDQVLQQDGTADRKAIAGVVFQHPAERERLEGLVHPMVEEVRREQVEEAKRMGKDLFVIDAPLLFEAELDKQCDAVVFVDAPSKVRIERVIKLRGWTPDELERREAAQLPMSQKRERSDFVVTNDGDISQVKQQVNDIIAILRTQTTGASERISPV